MPTFVLCRAGNGQGWCSGHLQAFHVVTMPQRAPSSVLMTACRGTVLCSVVVVLALKWMGWMISSHARRRGYGSLCVTLDMHPGGAMFDTFDYMEVPEALHGLAVLCAAAYCLVPVPASGLMFIGLAVWKWGLLRSMIFAAMSELGLDGLVSLLEPSPALDTDISDLPSLECHTEGSDSDDCGPSGGNVPSPPGRMTRMVSLSDTYSPRGQSSSCGAAPGPNDDELVYVGGAFGVLPRSVRDRWSETGSMSSGRGAGVGVGAHQSRGTPQRQLPPVRNLRRRRRRATTSVGRGGGGSVSATRQQGR